MSPKLKIVLIVIIVFMASLGFAATRIIFIQDAQIKSLQHSSTEQPTSQPSTPVVVHDPATSTNNGLAKAMEMLPDTLQPVTGYPISNYLYWVIADQKTSTDGSGFSESWVVDLAKSTAKMVSKDSALDSVFASSLSVTPQSLIYGYFTASLEGGWEGPPFRDTDVIDAKTGELIVRTEWIGDGLLTVVKGGKETPVAWHVLKPCKEGDEDKLVDVDGLTINGKLVPFPAATQIHCYFSEFDGGIHYEKFEVPTYSTEFDKAQVLHRVVRFQLPSKLTAIIDIDRLDTSGVSYEN